MEKMQDLAGLLKHEVEDLMSAEDQIIEAMPAMIERAKNSTLKKNLRDHLKVTQNQRKRLDKVQQLLNNGEEPGSEKKGFLSSLFGGSSKHECKGMKGLIEEGQKVMAEDMADSVMDAAIIACAQKIEHYEICGYGTARAYARELNNQQAAKLLEETLAEEYEADDLLTRLAYGSVNEEANMDGEMNSNRGSSSKTGSSKAAASKPVTKAVKKTATKKSANKSAKPAASKSANNKSVAKPAAKAKARK